jgi:hypothetical protein
MGCPPHPSHSLVPWRVQIAHVGASAWACLVLDFSLGRATLAFGGKKKKNSQNWLKFCMVVCGLILSILGKNRGQIL